MHKINKIAKNEKGVNSLNKRKRLLLIFLTTYVTPLKKYQLDNQSKFVHLTETRFVKQYIRSSQKFFLVRIWIGSSSHFRPTSPFISIFNKCILLRMFPSLKTPTG